MLTLVGSLGPIPSQPEPQLQPHEMIKQCQQVSKCNRCRDLFAKTDKNICRTSVPKKDAYSVTDNI